MKYFAFPGALLGQRAAGNLLNNMQALLSTSWERQTAKMLDNLPFVLQVLLWSQHLFSWTHLAIIAMKCKRIDGKGGQKTIIKWCEFGLINNGSLFYFKLKLEMPCRAIVYQKNEWSRSGKLKYRVMREWRMEKKRCKKREIQHEERGNWETVVLILLYIWRRAVGAVVPLTTLCFKPFLLTMVVRGTHLP